MDTTPSAQPEISPEIQSPVLEPHPSNRVPVVIGGLIAAIALGAVAFFAYQNMQLKKQLAQVTSTSMPASTSTPTPTVDPTANWKTYTNSDINFSIKVPPELTAKMSSKVKELDLLNNQGHYVISLSQFSDAVQENYDLNCSHLQKPDSSQNMNLTTPTSTMAPFVGEVVGYKRSPTQACWMVGSQFYFDVRNSDSSNGGQPTVSDQEFDQILSTLQFINSQVDTSNWKTYVDTNNTLSLQYPPTWTAYPNTGNLLFSDRGKMYTMNINSGGGDGPAADSLVDETVVYGGKTFTLRKWIKNGSPFFMSLINEEPSGVPFNSITISVPQDNVKSTIDIFTTILSTLRFTR
ncbi:hypothetical protein C5B42_01995 [Candidatus Cerribacteria bacterium 'Amazon FNV 2010 28 9']|uniref:Uncharacterized protein n=1 Tax=Candidatus Cerribacteria bacterium 'Amazon FNV 2010 28 9' TaxID=2081795 RepID=A0A317JQE8_9BACT|nr:MAG: hypothetical protein C5B42_01995 [Candidatus Cerribacteria bacterium 'Amazon FNV 2010 28 9']